MDGKASVWILGNQLIAGHPAIKAAEARYGRDNLAILLIESEGRVHTRPYQRKKLVLLFSGMRHFAEELRQQGYQVDYFREPSFTSGLRRHVARWRPDQLFTMAASDVSGRRFQTERLERQLHLPVSVLPNTQFLTSEFDPYPEADPGKRIRMEHFYRRMRRHFGILMEGEAPAGGSWNYDKENRKPLPKGDQPPRILSFEPDAITRQVMEDVARLEIAVGTSEAFDLGVTRQHALAALDEFVQRRFAQFGSYEDAMSSQHQYLYHSNLSAYLNLGLLQPLELVHIAEKAYAGGSVPINSAEGFIRQILGWREYVYWQYWRLMPRLYEGNYWEARRPLPGFFWDGDTEMNCLRHVLQRTIETGYAHHIERLMILCNFCLLAGIEPLAVNDWFLSMFIDAYDWVMGPNVLGMGLNADGGLVGSKPYIASANYINKMSDYCGGCGYNRRARTGASACPFNTLYWNFLIENETKLRANPRLGASVLGLRHLSQAERLAVRQDAARFLNQLAGE